MASARQSTAARRSVGSGVIRTKGSTSPGRACAAQSISAVARGASSGSSETERRAAAAPGVATTATPSRPRSARRTRGTERKADSIPIPPRRAEVKLGPYGLADRFPDAYWSAREDDVQQSPPAASDEIPSTDLDYSASCGRQHGPVIKRYRSRDWIDTSVSCPASAALCLQGRGQRLFAFCARCGAVPLVE